MTNSSIGAILMFKTNGPLRGGQGEHLPAVRTYVLHGSPYQCGKEAVSILADFHNRGHYIEWSGLCRAGREVGGVPVMQHVDLRAPSENLTTIAVTDTMSVPQCIGSLNQDMTDASAIMAIGYDADEKFFLRSAGLDNKEALWLLEDAKEHVRDISEAAHE